MNCKMCSKNEPKHFFRCLITNNVVDTFICEECFQKIAKGENALGMIGDEIIVEGTDEDQNLSRPIQNVAELKCPCCDTDLSEVGKTGRFGCEKCYEVFSDLIAVADVQIDEKEKKLKETLGDKAQESVESGKIAALENKMQDAIKIEDYETAAKLRDEISKLKRESSKDGKAVK